MGFLDLDDALVTDSIITARAVTSQDRRNQLIVELAHAMDMGQPKHGAELLSQLPDSLPQWSMVVAGYLNWDGDSARAESRARKLRAAVPTLSLTESRGRTSRISALFTIARYELSRGDTVFPRRILQQIRQITIPDSMPAAKASRDEFALLLDTELAIHSRRPELRQLLTRVDSAVRSGRNGEMANLGPLLGARGWERLDDPTHALATLRRQFRLWGFEIYASTKLREEGRLATLTGDRAGAIRAYRQFLHLRRDPEPSLRADTERIRAELRRLEQAEPTLPR
jgi:hypothetical protein